MTLIEIMISSVALLVIAASVGQQLIGFKKFEVHQRLKDSETMIVHTLLEQVRSRIEVYAKSYVPLAASDYPTELNSLVTHLNGTGGSGWTHAWSQEFFGPKSECPNCEGRAIYIIEQSRVCASSENCDGTSDLTELYLGLYRVRVVLQHPRVFPSPPHAREYQFLVGSR